MADNDQAQGGGAEMPTPTFVVDVSCDHIYSGRVFKQYYVFLWVSIAFVIGCMLPWSGTAVGGDGGMTLLQAILLVCAIGCTCNMIAVIRSMRLTFWPVMALEILALLFLFLHYDYTTNLSDAQRDAKLAEIKAEREMVPADIASNRTARADRDNHLRNRHNEMIAEYDWGLTDVAFGAFTTFRAAGTPERTKFDRAWGSFGTGFHLCWVTCVFLFAFIIGSVVFAVITAKPKEDPKLARRRARESGRAGGEKKDKDEGGAKDLGMKETVRTDLRTEGESSSKGK